MGMRMVMEMIGGGAQGKEKRERERGGDNTSINYAVREENENDGLGWVVADGWMDG